MESVTLFLAGDVMTGRGIDQAMGTPLPPAIHEPCVHDARHYVELAEAAHGPIPRPISPDYPWGDALAILEELRPAARIVNLETSITTSDAWCRTKDIHYRMHPAHVACLTALGIDVATLANNHTLDWGRTGLLETLQSLRRAGIRTAGAGTDAAESRQPAIVPVDDGGRVLLWAVGTPSSGIPADWRAGPHDPGLELIDAPNDTALTTLAARVAAHKRPGDLAVLSIHWGSNWGFDVAAECTAFAHGLVDAGFDCVHGHSSHHVRPIEVYRDRLILYGCGDFLDDYEGIDTRVARRYRGDLGLMYAPTLDAPSGRLVALSMVPLQARRFRLERVGEEDTRWLAATLTRISRPFGCHVVHDREGSLSLRWQPAGGSAAPARGKQT